MRIIIVGAGTVGTATGKSLSTHGHHIEYVDTSTRRVEDLRKTGQNAYTPDQIDLNNCGAVFMSVSTPSDENGINTTNLIEATENLGRKLQEFNTGFPTIIFRSTQPPGTTRNSLIPRLQHLSNKQVNTDFGVTYWPEYLRAATAQCDFDNPPVITIATLQKNDPSHHASAKIALDFQTAIHWLPLEAAELQKYVNNVGNAIKISTYNWFRELAKKIGLQTGDIEHVFKLCTLSAEGLWNPEYGLKDFGPYGGACLPKDIVALKKFAETAGLDTALLDAAERVNKNTPGG